MAQLFYCSKCWSSLIRCVHEGKAKWESVCSGSDIQTHSSTRQGEGLRGQLSPWPLPLSACSRSGIMVSFLLRCPSSCQHIWLRYIHVIRGHRESHFVPFPGVKSHTPTFSVLCTLWCFVVNCLRPVMSYRCACPPPPSPTSLCLLQLGCASPGM